jgi:hypothetical protein
MPDLGEARNKQDPDHDLLGRPDQVGSKHHQLARQPVGPHAADQKECDPAESRARENQAKL